MNEMIPKFVNLIILFLKKKKVINVRHFKYLYIGFKKICYFYNIKKLGFQIPFFIK